MTIKTHIQNMFFFIFFFLTLTSFFNTPLFANNEKPYVKELTSVPEDVEIPEEIKDFLKNPKLTKLDKSILTHNLDKVKILIKEGAVVNPEKTEEGFPLMYAVIANNPLIVEYLLKNGANIESTLKGGVTPLFMSVTWNLLDVTKVLLANKPNINKILNDVTVLDLSFNYNFFEITPLLIKNGAKKSSELKSSQSSKK